MIKNVCVFLVVLLSLISFLIRQLFQFCCFFSLLKILWVFSRFLLISHGSCQLSSDICKHFKVLKWPSVLHPYVFWADYLLSVQKYLVFSAFGEGCLCLLKMFLHICRLYFIQFLHEIYMEKVLQELVWVPFFECPYHSNGTKLHLVVALIMVKYSWHFENHKKCYF